MWLTILTEYSWNLPKSVPAIPECTFSVSKPTSSRVINWKPLPSKPTSPSVVHWKPILVKRIVNTDISSKPSKIS